jgi:hypothetical protein
MKLDNHSLTPLSVNQNNRATIEQHGKKKDAPPAKKRKPWKKPTLTIKKRHDWTKVETQVVSDIRKDQNQQCENKHSH